MFHSVAAALEQMLQLSPAAAQHVLSKMPRTENPLQVFTDKRLAVDWLRDLSAQALEHWPPEKFLDYVLRAAMSEQLRAFEDRWSPVGLLRDARFDCLIDQGHIAESVLAFEDTPDGDAVMRVAYTRAVEGGGTREERLIRVEQGPARLFHLRD